MVIFKDKTIILGITGGIAAYKAAEVCSTLVKTGAEVHVVMTKSAKRFVGPATFRALTGRQVITSMWEEPREYEITHVSLPEKADLFLIAPATANIIGKTASGIADDMLSTMIMATKAPVIFAPAMNCNMWENPIVQKNIEHLRSLGYHFIGPEYGHLACGEEGTGRMSSPEEIVKAAAEILQAKHDMQEVTVLVTAGPTHESIDPVRFIANRSSGKMGYAIAQAAAERAARVILVSGPTLLPTPAGVELISVQTAAEMLDAVLDKLPEAQVIIGAAAVADYTPKAPKESKIKKTDSSLMLELEPTKDIVGEVGRRKGQRILAGFAAETENILEQAKKKLETKNMDIIIANDVSKPGIGFGSDTNEVTIIGADGRTDELPRMPKIEAARKIMDRIKELLNRT